MSEPYYINWTTTDSNIGKNPFLVDENTEDAYHTSLTIFGKNTEHWGEKLQENLLHLMEHFASPVAPDHPTVGQYWFDTARNVMRCYYNGTWNYIGIQVGPSTTHSEPRVWYDTTVNELKWWGGDVVGWISLQDKLSRSGDIMLGDLTLSRSPTEPLHAATKQYVDTVLTIQGDGVLQSGHIDITNGDLILQRSNALTDVVITNIAPKSYVDSSILTKLDTSGGILNGMLTLAADPTADLHAATKQYVDTKITTVQVAGGVSGGSINFIDNTLTLTRTQQTDLVITGIASLYYVNSQLSMKLGKLGGTLSGPLYLNSDPTTNLQAATKQYVDVKSLKYLPLIGGSMLGDLILQTNPTVDMHAATKRYVDIKIGNVLPLSGGLLTGPLSVQSDPTTNLQVATKQYVDNTAVSITGDVMTGSLTLSGDPTNLLHATPKQYVDNNFIKKTGDIMSGTLLLNATPTAPMQAATKQYVDGLAIGLRWINPIQANGLIDVNIIVPPTVPKIKDSYIVGIGGIGDWVGKDSHLMEWNGTAWIDLGLIYVGMRVGLSMESITPCAGTLAGSDNQIITISSVSPLNYMLTIPVDKDAVLLNNSLSTDAFHQYVYDASISSWIEFSGLVGITAGDGLVFQGNQLTVSGIPGQIDASSGQVGLSVTGVIPGDYIKHSVDQFGRIYAGSNTLLPTDIPSISWTKVTSDLPTTLSGFGITDAAPLQTHYNEITSTNLQSVFTFTGFANVPNSHRLTVFVEGIKQRESTYIETTADITFAVGFLVGTVVEMYYR